MILYLLNKIISTGELPDKLIDENVKTDYSKLRKIAEFFTSKEEMNEIIENGKTTPIEIKDRFNLESLYVEDARDSSLKSLLYYMGMLTIDMPIENATILRIPNYAIKQLYWEYIYKTYQIDNSIRYEQLKAAMMKMRLEGKLDDLIGLYQKVINNLSSRDMKHFNEASCKCIFITLMFTDGIYLIESERQADGGYSDLYVKEGYLFNEYVKYRYIFEFKYIKRSEITGDVLITPKEELYKKNSALIASYKDAAKKQLAQYMTDFNVINDSDRILKKYTIVVIGRKYVEVDEVI
jgi:hypothetical protein